MIMIFSLFAADTRRHAFAIADITLPPLMLISLPLPRSHVAADISLAIFLRRAFA